jgi:hypothetical protein
LDPQKGTIANAHCLVRTGPSRKCNTNVWSWAVRPFVPFSGARDQIAILITSSNVSDDDRGQGAGPMQFTTPLFDLPFLCEIAQQVFEAEVAALQAERACDFTFADLTGPRSDKANKILPRRKGTFFLAVFLGQVQNLK